MAAVAGNGGLADWQTPIGENFETLIVRAIAGAEAGIVRAGFRPLRQQPQRYDYSTMLVCLRHRES